jgi:hypothetical protein
MCSESRVGVTGRWAENASHYLLSQPRRDVESFPAIYEGQVGKPERALALHKGLKLFGLGLALGQHQVTALLVADLGLQLFGQGMPTRTSSESKSRFRRLLLPQAYASGTGPGGGWLLRDFAAFHDQHCAPLPGDVIGDGTANDPAANN